jgi:hypothetical protein
MIGKIFRVDFSKLELIISVIGFFFLNFFDFLFSEIIGDKNDKAFHQSVLFRESN